MTAAPTSYLSEKAGGQRFELRIAVGTGAAKDESLVSQQNVDPWDKLLNEVEMLAGDATELLSQDMEPPTDRAVSCAVDTMTVLRKKHVPVPFRVVPNGEGGLAIEWISGRQMVRTIEIFANAEIEVTEFSDNKFINRYRV